MEDHDSEVWFQSHIAQRSFRSHLKWDFAEGSDLSGQRRLGNGGGVCHRVRVGLKLLPQGVAISRKSIWRRATTSWGEST